MNLRSRVAVALSGSKAKMYYPTILIAIFSAFTESPHPILLPPQLSGVSQYLFSKQTQDFAGEPFF